MSYEGRCIVLCQNGHKDSYDAYDTPNLHQAWECPVCGTGACWCEQVDDTNGPGVETKLVEYKSEQVEVCPCCGANKQLAFPQYYIPVLVENDWEEESSYINEPLIPTKRCKYTIHGLEDKEFDSEEQAWEYHSSFYLERPDGEAGRRKGFKIPRDNSRAGSTPAPGKAS